MKEYLLLVIGALTSISANTQNLEYGRVDKIDFTLVEEELIEKQEAIVILKKEYIDFERSDEGELIQRRMVHERIKINSVAGLKYATRKIPLYLEDGKIGEEFKFLKAATYNLVDGRIKRTKIKSSAVFKEDISDQYRLKSFTMPNVKIGSVIEYSYVIESSYAVIDNIILQYDIPILNIDVALINERYRYELNLNPRATYIPKIEKTEGKRSYTTTTKTRSGIYVTSTEYKRRTYDRKIKITSIKGSNVPPLISEPMAGNINNYRSEIIVELVKATKDVNGGLALNDWETITNSIMLNKNFGDQLKTTFFNQDVESTIKKIKTDLKKMKFIFHFVKQKVKWNGKYGKYTRNGVEEAYKIGSGDVAEINLLLTSMLKSAGLEAYPVLVSTKNNGIPFYPTKDGFNYVIAGVKKGNETYLLDATEKYTAINILPNRILNWKGRLLKSDGSSEWVDLFNNEVSKEIIFIKAEFKNKEIKFKTKKRLTQYFALNTRHKYSDQTISSIQDDLKDGDSTIEISKVDIENMDIEDAPLTISYEGTVSNLSEQIGDRLFITPLLTEVKKENPFKLEKRKYLLDLEFPFSRKTIVNLKIPEGYELEFLPESVKLVYNDGLGSYSYKTSKANGTIVVVVDYDLDIYLIEPEDYGVFRNFFIDIVAKNAERIVLRRIK
jgi:hypothetical protein